MTIGLNADVETHFTYQDLEKQVLGKSSNRGELKLKSNGKLETVNNCSYWVSKNNVVLSREENARVRSAVYKAIAAHVEGTYGQGGGEAVRNYLKEVRLALFGEGRAGESLSRDEVRIIMTTSVENAKDIPINCRTIRAIKQEGARAKVDGKPVADLGRFVQGYAAGAKTNDFVLEVTQNKLADKAWRQAMENVQKTVREVVDEQIAGLRLPDSVGKALANALANHLILSHEKEWEQKADASQLPDRAEIAKLVDDALYRGGDGAGYEKVLLALQDFSEAHPVLMTHLLKSGIDLFAAGLDAADPEAAFKSLARGLGDLAGGKALGPLALCEKLLARAGHGGIQLVGDLDLATASRTELLETCAGLCGVIAGPQVEADFELTTEGVMDVHGLKNPNVSCDATIKEVLNGDSGKRFLSLLQDGCLVYGFDRGVGRRVAALLRKTALRVSEGERKAALEELVKELADRFVAPGSDFLKTVLNAAQDGKSDIVESFVLQRKDRLQVEETLAGARTFLEAKFGGNWTETHPPLAEYLNGLEAEMRTGGTVFLTEPTDLDKPEHAELLRSPLVKFRVEQLKAIVESVGVDKLGDGSVVLRIANGADLDQGQAKIYSEASGKALLAAIPPYQVASLGCRRLYCPELESPEKTEALKKLFVPKAAQAFANGLKLTATGDVFCAWGKVLGEQNAAWGAYLDFYNWGRSCCALLDRPVKDVFDGDESSFPEMAVLSGSGIDLTQLDLSLFQKADSRHLVGPFLLAVLSENGKTDIGELNAKIGRIGGLQPEAFGLKRLSAEDRMLFDFLKWTHPVEALALADAEANEWQAQSFVTLFNGLRRDFTELAGEYGGQDRDGFRANLMQKALSMSQQGALYRAIRRQQSDKGFTVRGYYESRLNQRKNLQTEFSQTAQAFLRDYGGYLPYLDASEVDDEILALCGLKSDDLDPQKNYELDDEANEKLSKAQVRLADRCEYLRKLLNQSQQGDEVFTQAAARILAFAPLSGSYADQGGEVLVTFLKDFAASKKADEWADGIKGLMAGLPDTKDDLMRFLKGIVDYSVDRLGSFMTDHWREIFLQKAETGVVEEQKILGGLFCEMLGMNRDLSVRFMEAVQDEGVSRELVDHLVAAVPRLRVGSKKAVAGINFVVIPDSNGALPRWVMQNEIRHGASVQEDLAPLRMRIDARYRNAAGAAAAITASGLQVTLLSDLAEAGFDVGERGLATALGKLSAATGGDFRVQGLKEAFGKVHSLMNDEEGCRRDPFQRERELRHCCSQFSDAAEYLTSLQNGEVDIQLNDLQRTLVDIFQEKAQLYAVRLERILCEQDEAGYRAQYENQGEPLPVVKAREIARNAGMALNKALRSEFGQVPVAAEKVKELTDGCEAISRAIDDLEGGRLGGRTASEFAVVLLDKVTALIERLQALGRESNLNTQTVREVLKFAIATRQTLAGYVSGAAKLSPGAAYTRDGRTISFNSAMAVKDAFLSDLNVEGYVELGQKYPEEMIEFFVSDDCAYYRSKELGKGAYNTANVNGLVTGSGKAVQLVSKDLSKSHEGLGLAPYAKLGITQDQDLARINYACWKAGSVVLGTQANVKSKVSVLGSGPSSPDKTDYKPCILMEKAGGQKFGTFCRKVTDPAAFAAQFGPSNTAAHWRGIGTLLKTTNELDWTDWLTAQGDRHYGNMMIDVDDRNVFTVKGIDNDLSFPANRPDFDKVLVDPDLLKERVQYVQARQLTKKKSDYPDLDIDDITVDTVATKVRVGDRDLYEVELMVPERKKFSPEEIQLANFKADMFSLTALRRPHYITSGQLAKLKERADELKAWNEIMKLEGQQREQALNGFVEEWPQSVYAQFKDILQDSRQIEGMYSRMDSMLRHARKLEAEGMVLKEELLSEENLQLAARGENRELENFYNRLTERILEEHRRLSEKNVFLDADRFLDTIFNFMFKLHAKKAQSVGEHRH